MVAAPINDRAAPINKASIWLRSQKPRPSPVVPALRERFDLTAKEAVLAIHATLSGRMVE